MSVPGDITVTAEFLDPAAIARILERRQAAAVGQAAKASAEAMPVLRWTIGEEHYGTPLHKVREVAKAERITPVPGAPASLRGLVAWRGEVLNLFDPAPVLGASGDIGTDSRMIVLRSSRTRLALHVSAVTAVVPVEANVLAGFEGLTRFIDAEDGGGGFSIVSTEQLVEELLAGRHYRGG